MRPSMLAATLRKKKKDHLIALTKSVGIIQVLVDKSLHPQLHEKSAAEMWAILSVTPKLTRETRRIQRRAPVKS